jgi:transcriptional regulator with XRE-family HTH domain
MDVTVSPEVKYGRMGDPLKPSQVFAKRLREVRTRRKWSMRQLSERLEELGVKLNTSQIAKIETGVRDISLDEALSIALALGVSPLHLFIPIEEVQQVALAPNFTQAPTVARTWVRGGTLPFAANEEDHRFFKTEAPMTELRARTNPRMLHLEWVYFALLANGVNIERVEELFLKLKPETPETLIETLEAVKPLIQKGHTEGMEQLAEWALNDPELLRRITGRLQVIREAQEGEAK